MEHKKYSLRTILKTIVFLKDANPLIAIKSIMNLKNKNGYPLKDSTDCNDESNDEYNYKYATSTTTSTNQIVDCSKM